MLEPTSPYQKSCLRNHVFLKSYGEISWVHVSWESWFICLFLDQQLVCKWQIPLILFCQHLSVKLGLLWKELFLLDRQKPNWLVDLRGGKEKEEGGGKGREGEWEGGEGGCGSPYVCPGNFLSFLWLHQHLSEPWPSRFTPRARFSPASLHWRMRVFTFMAHLQASRVGVGKNCLPASGKPHQQC